MSLLFFVPSECGGFVARKIAEDEDMMSENDFLYIDYLYIYIYTQNSSILYIGGDFLLHLFIVNPDLGGEEIQ